MKYIFLIINQEIDKRSAKRGDISVYKPYLWEWGKKETLPRFEKIVYDCDKEEANYIVRHCIYSFEKKCFIYKDNNENFDKEDVIKKKDFHPRSDAKETVEKDFNIKTDNDCSFLSPSWLEGKLKSETSLNQMKFRIECCNILNKYKKYNGIKNLLRAIRYGDFKNIYVAFKTLPNETKNEVFIKDILGDKIYNWLKEQWKLI